MVADQTLFRVRESHPHTRKSLSSDWANKYIPKNGDDDGDDVYIKMIVVVVK